MSEVNWITRKGPFFNLCIGGLQPDQTLTCNGEFVQRFICVTAGSGEIFFDGVSNGQTAKGGIVDCKSHLGTPYTGRAGDNGVSWVSFNKDIDDTDFTVEVNSSSGDDVVIAGDDNKVFVSLYSRLLLNDTLIGVGKYVRLESGRDYTVSGNDKSFWAIATKQ